MDGEVNYAGNIGSGAATGAALGGPYGALIGAGAGLALSGIEYYQNKKQQAIDEANRPQYEIPKEVDQGLTLAQHQAAQGLPEAQKQQYLQNLQRGAAYSLGQQSSRKGGLAGLASINENLNQGYGNLLAQDSAARMANQNKVYGQLQNVADYKGQQFQLNQLNPYYENVARTSANRGAMYQNVNKSLQLGMYGLGATGGGGDAQSTQGVGASPQGTQVGYSAGMNEVGLAPGADSSQYANQGNGTIPNAFPQGNMLGTTPYSRSLDKNPAFPMGNYGGSPYTPYQR